MQSLFKNKKVLYGVPLALVCIIAIWFGVAKNGNGSDEVITIEKRDVVERVVLSGTVEADIVSDLGFEASGVVRDVFVSVNDVVFQGATLARLGLGTLQAELQSAQASLLIKKAQVANTTVSLDTVKKKQDTLVANALSEMLSDDVEAEPQSSTFTQTIPTITGRYVGEPGTYKIRIESGVQQSRETLRVFDLESTEEVEINRTGPTPLGTRGLFISFPDAISTYRNTTWFVTLPNEKGVSYTTNYNAYQTALNERQRAIEDAEAELRAQNAGSSIAEAEVVQAQAEVTRVGSQIRERTLVAPFNGIVTAVHIDPGESAAVGVPAVSLISQGGFGVEIDLPEIDSIKVKIGDKTSVILDAFGTDTIFSATVVSVNRTETIVDSVSVYEARIAFDVQDERIASGMTAEVTITTDEQKGVLAVPARAILYRTDGAPYVSAEIGGNGETQEVDVTLGLRGSDGFFEVLSGLSEGDRVHISS
ncbi:MAG: HlyD family efflux transporter periplasmic adaptor subunit [Candidatus Campbellbacteria bacterium]|nr:HlyD family efflux transporter periplasmic adaptor subunit [Candidatus Campbellbacteria bacterium]